MAARKAVLTQLIQDAVLKLCTQNVEFDESLEIDGIICITHSQIAPEIVVKMHRTIMKPEEPPVQSDPSLQWTEQQQQQYTEPMSQAAKGSIAGRSGGAYATAESFDLSGGTQFIGGMNQVQGYVADSQETYQSDSTSKDSNYGTPKSQRKRKKQPEVQAQAESITKQIKVEDTDDAIYIEDTGSEPPGGSMDQQQGNYSSLWQLEQQQPQHDLLATECRTTSSSNHSKASSSQSETFTETLNINYQCEQCPRDFPSCRCLEYHTLQVHSKYCDICNDRLDSEPDIQHHGLKHKGSKPHQCGHCYKLFRSQGGLNLHLAKDVKCQLCGKTFQPHLTLKHMKQYHGGV